MKRSLACVLIVMCAFIYSPRVFAWTDDVEGMLMPSPRGEDNMSDPKSVMENIEGSEDMHLEDTAPTIEWE